MKIMAIGWHVGMLVVMVAAILRVAPHWVICLALGSLGFHSWKEIKAWWKL